MKILHTADWHLGQVLCNFDRQEEQLSMLSQFQTIVEQEKPDVFVLAGDIYDVAQPSAGVQKMFNDAILSLHHACPEMTIVCISGNHDSGTRHIVYQNPWKDLRVYVAGTIQREQPENHIIEIPGKGFVVAVPYAAERLMPEGFYQSLYDLVAERNTENLPVVLTAHLALKACDPTGNSISDNYIGGIECADAADFSRYDYVALGHIHKPQFVDKAKRIRYAGTPIPISFDEVYPGCEHSVSIVEIDHQGEQPRLTTIDIQNPRPLVTISVKGTESLTEVSQEIAAFPKDNKAYIRLNVEVPQGETLPYSDGDIRHLLQDKQANFCYINSVRESQPKQESNSEKGNEPMTVSDFQHLNPVDVMERWFKSQDKEFTDECRQMFHEVENRLEEQANQ